MKKNVTTFNTALKQYENICSFSISPILETKDLQDLSSVSIDSGTKMQLSSLVNQLPSAYIAANSSGLYKVSFPEGLPNSLTKLKQGGYGSMIKDPETGKFVGSASFEEVSYNAALLGAFTAISVITSQYFLAEINKNIKIINQKLDKIMEFLYGDKKAELIAEINFAKYAYQNYMEIMKNESHKIATITSLQEARKIAMKDIEFYISDLDSSVNTDAKLGNTMDEVVNKSFQIYDSVDLSLQLYAISTLLEVYYSQNMNTAYVSYLSEDLKNYIDKCDKRALADLSILKRRLDDFKTIAPIKGKLDKASLISKLDQQIDMIHESGNTAKYEAIQKAIIEVQKPSEYIISESGDLYKLREGA